MQIIYEGTDITGSVIPSACTHKDVSHGKADVLEIVFRRPSAWHRWSPETDDEIQIVSGKYDTGIMYVNTLVPEGEQYRLIATSLPSKAARKAWDNYRDMDLQAIMHRLAVECDMAEKATVSQRALDLVPEGYSDARLRVGEEISISDLVLLSIWGIKVEKRTLKSIWRMRLNREA